MSDAPDSLVLRMLGRMDDKLDRVLSELTDIKPRVPALQEATAGVDRRIDRMDLRLDRIERRLDLVDTPQP